MTKLESKILVDYMDDKKEKVLFMYDCPNECMPRRAFYNTGEEYISKPILCIKCNGNVERNHKRVDEKKIVSTDKCLKCGHVEIEEMELGAKVEDKPDPEFENDRAKFCYPGEFLNRSIEEARRWKQLGELVDSWKEKEEHKEEYEKVNNLKKLSIPQLKLLVSDAINKEENYTNLIFEAPQMSQVVSIGFTLEDLTTQEEYYSRTKLSKLLKNLLLDTNWRLMSDGVHYRLGILSGRFRVYESEKDLLKLMKES